MFNFKEVLEICKIDFAFFSPNREKKRTNYKNSRQSEIY